MEIAFYCVLIMFILQVLSKTPVAWGQIQLGGYNNKTPREQQALLEGWGKRALASHKNTFESFPGFAAAVILCAVTGVADASLVNKLAVVFVVCRVLYLVMYLINKDMLRSTVWGVAWGINIYLFILAIP